MPAAPASTRSCASQAVNSRGASCAGAPCAKISKRLVSSKNHLPYIVIVKLSHYLVGKVLEDQGTLCCKRPFRDSLQSSSQRCVTADKRALISSSISCLAVSWSNNSTTVSPEASPSRTPMTAPRCTLSPPRLVLTIKACFGRSRYL